MTLFKAGWKTSEFWTHLAVTTASLGTSLGTVFDKTYTAQHPLIAGLTIIGGLLCAAVSQAAYVISRGLAKGATNPDTTPLQ